MGGRKQHKFPRSGKVVRFAPKLDPGKYDLEYASRYAGLWAYGYQTLHLGETESVYRTVLDFATESLLHDKEARIIDLGCGVGRITSSLAGRFSSMEFVGLDASLAMLNLAEKFVTAGREVELDLSEFGYLKPLRFVGAGLPNVRFYQGDATKTPFGDSTFSLVVSCNLIDRVPSPREVFREIRRVLRQGGRAVITSPLNWDRRENWVLFPGRDQVIEGLKAEGLDIIEWFDGLRYREYLDARGNYSDWNTLAVIVRK